jgi:AraC family transcriptional regulator
MDGAVPTSPAFACVRDGQRVGSLLDAARAQSVTEGFWGAVRAHHVRSEFVDQELTAPVNNIITLSIAGPPSCETSLEGGPWHSQRMPLQTVSVFPAHVGHGMRVREPGEFLIVEVAEAFTVSALGRTGELTALRPELAVQDALARHVLLALAEEARAPLARGTLKAESLATALVAHIADRESLRARAPAAVVAALSSPRLRRVLDYIGAHLDTPLALRSLSDMVDMDMFRFTRAFKQSTGLSPHRYVLEARIHRAKELLRTTELPITEVALQTGFSTPSHFSVTFRRLASVTPREYREGRA